ncbi:WXG100-like domain-containing protein [Nocardia gipuzkoensis]
MTVEVPHEVALFLNFLGVPYPDIDEDQVRELAYHVRTFATNVQNTHESASGAVRDMGSVYSGESYEAMVASWARMSSTHMADLDRACRAVAKALDITADVITAVKIAVLAELAAMAAAYAALIATTVATGGASAALTIAVRTAVRKLVSAMEEMLVAYLAAEVVSKAIEPFEHTIERMINGAVYDAAKDVLGVPSPSPSSVPALYIEPDEVLRYAAVLDELSEQMIQHAVIFAENVAALNFTESSSLGGLNAADKAPSPTLPAVVPHPEPEFESRSSAVPELARNVTWTRLPEPALIDAGQSSSKSGDRSDIGHSDNPSGYAAATKPADLTVEGRAIQTSPSADQPVATASSTAIESRAPMTEPTPCRQDRVGALSSEMPAAGVPRPVGNHDASAEQPLTTPEANAPEIWLSTERRASDHIVENGLSNAPSALPSSHAHGVAPPTPRSDPWQRSGQQQKQSMIAARAASRSGGPRDRRSASARMPMSTPWSKSVALNPAAVPRVTAPDVARRPLRQVGSQATESEQVSDSVHSVVAPREGGPDTSQPR